MKKREHSGTHLPRTSRVNDKIIEYYTKFGKERDLEKFMRLYSPGSSQISRSLSRSQTTTTTATTATTNSSEGASAEDSSSSSTLRRLFREKKPTLELEMTDQIKTKQSKKCIKSSGSRKNAKEINIPIRVEKTKRLVVKATADKKMSSESIDELKTPQKTKVDSKATQTPDSVSKSHRRLEWDSLGDVGYKKSMSTSNISTLERSLLKEFFEENGLLPQNMATNSSENDLKSLKMQLIGDSKYINKAIRNKHNTPPLASSTFVDSLVKSRSGGHRKCTSDKAVSTSLLEKPERLEKSAQTSLRAPVVNSQEVQVDIQTAKSSLIGSSTTQTSFEYFSSHSSQTTTNSTDSADFRIHRRQKNSFVAGITEMLARRKGLANNNNNNQIETDCEERKLQELHDSIKNAFINNESSIFLSSPQLDLGVKLLCSLIEAKSVNQAQKSKLVRDIVERICVSVERKDITNLQHVKGVEVSHPKVNATLETKTDNDNSSTNPSSSLQAQKISQSENSFPKKSVDLNTAVTRQTSPKKHKKSKDEFKAKLKKNPTFDTAKLTNDERKNYTNVILIQKTTVAAKTEESSCIATTNSLCTTACSSSKELTTQKGALTNSADDEQTTINEWLNPMTQSEIEYEEKKRGSKPSKTNERKTSANSNSQDDDSERDAQINWIESEIKRLESLRHLLLHDENSKSNSNKNSISKTKSKQKEDNTITSKDNDVDIYDTVCSLQSYLRNEDDEIELIIEESNDGIDKPQEAKIQVVYDKPAEESVSTSSEKHCSVQHRTKKKTLNNLEIQIQQPCAKNVAVSGTQRSKIDTPTDSIDVDADADAEVDVDVDVESVSSYVRQRTRDFKERYKNKKQTNYETIIQKQQKQLKLLQRQLLEQQRKHQQNKQRPISQNEHYSVPHTMQRENPLGYLYSEFNYKKHPVSKTSTTSTTTISTRTPHAESHDTPMPPPPTNSPPVSPLCNSRPQIIYGVTENSSRAGDVDTGRQNNRAFEQQPDRNTSSMLCLSSDVSIPMGVGTSSTVTTTHQYDDVAGGATGVAVQTGSSLLRTGAVFNKQNYQIIRTKSSTKSVCIQIKPKSVAYIIDFIGDKQSDFPQHAIKVSDLGKQPTIREQLEKKNPKFCARSKERKTILNRLYALRQERESRLRQIVENTSINSLDRKLKRLPPPPTKQLRIFKTTEMKAMTNKRCAYLPEILAKQQHEREDHRRRHNRLISCVFSRRLQQRVRRGQLSLNHSNTVI